MESDRRNADLMRCATLIVFHDRTAGAMFEEVWRDAHLLLIVSIRLFDYCKLIHTDLYARICGLLIIDRGSSVIGCVNERRAGFSRDDDCSRVRGFVKCQFLCDSIYSGFAESDDYICIIKY